MLVVNRANEGAGRLAGVVLGGAAGVLIGRSVDCEGFFCQAGGAALGGVLGAILGAGIGTEVGRAERWRPVETSGVRIVLLPHGVGINLHL
jgi:hypothetical protein